MLQENQSTLCDELHKTIEPDTRLCDIISNMGFDVELIRQALKENTNDMQKTIESLLKMQTDGTYENALKEVLKNVQSFQDATNQPSTSHAQAVQDLTDEKEVSQILCMHAR